MQIKTLKFTKKNLKTHTDWHTYKYNNTIYTCRDESKGENGDIFYIAGLGYFVLVSKTRLYKDATRTTEEEWDIASEYEGFGSDSEALKKELEWLYPISESYIQHELLKLNQSHIEELKTALNSNKTFD